MPDNTTQHSIAQHNTTQHDTAAAPCRHDTPYGPAPPPPLGSSGVVVPFGASVGDANERRRGKQMQKGRATRDTLSFCKSDGVCNQSGSI